MRYSRGLFICTQEGFFLNKLVHITEKSYLYRRIARYHEKNDSDIHLSAHPAGTPAGLQRSLPLGEDGWSHRLPDRTTPRLCPAPSARHRLQPPVRKGAGSLRPALHCRKVQTLPTCRHHVHQPQHCILLCFPQWYSIFPLLGG